MVTSKVLKLVENNAKDSEVLEIAGVSPPSLSPPLQPCPSHSIDRTPNKGTRHSKIMEVTDFIFNEREEALLVGDYNAYRAHTTRKLQKLRKKLGQATPKGRKYTAKPAVTAENVGNNLSYVTVSSSGFQLAC